MDARDVLLHEVSTSKGDWGIFVQSVAESRNGEKVFLTMILERSIDDEHIISRKLAVAAGTADLNSPSGRLKIIEQIRKWIETTEGAGSLEACEI